MKKNMTYNMVVIAMFAAILSIIAPFSVPIGPIPISLATLIVMIIGISLGLVRGLAVVGIYLLLGLVGVPVFSNWGAGAAKLLGPTGGFLIGYLFLVALTGLFAGIAKKASSKVMYYVLLAAGMIIGTILLYFFGTVWFLILLEDRTLSAALSACVIPFLPGDALKCIVAALVGPALAKVVKRYQKQ
ncbi:MAG: biotin transporter BioY [Lachnospiraceae bacterium]|nr:biotin transporter BioY [Lachnospiraceae bacterium]